MTKVSTSIGRCARLLLLAFAPLTAGAAGEAADEQFRQLDSEIQALKGEVLDINQSSLGVEEKFLYPGRTRVIVYVGVKPPGLLVDDIVVTIDSAQPVVHRCDTQESYALQRKGLLRVARTNVLPGSHRIRADITAHYADAAAGTPPYKLHLEQLFDKTIEPSYLELSLFLKGLDNTPQLRLRDWRVSQ
jgi:hypothetical protein